MIESRRIGKPHLDPPTLGRSGPERSAPAAPAAHAHRSAPAGMTALAFRRPPGLPLEQGPEAGVPRRFAAPANGGGVITAPRARGSRDPGPFRVKEWQNQSNILF